MFFEDRPDIFAGWLNDTEGEIAERFDVRLVDDAEMEGLGDERLTDDRAMRLGADEVAMGELDNFDFGFMFGLQEPTTAEDVLAPPLVSI